MTLKEIEEAVCRKYEISGMELRIKSRKREYVEPRQIAMTIAVDNVKSSGATIGAFFGSFDHATVLHAQKTIHNLAETNVEWKWPIITRSVWEEELRPLCYGCNQSRLGRQSNTFDPRSSG